MSITRSVAEILSEDVTLELEGIDRMYLDVYVPRLQPEAGVQVSSAQYGRVARAFFLTAHIMA